MNSAEKGRATINDVAAKAQVSKKTVSRVINNETNVKQETRERVQQAMSDLNYFPSLSARSLASKRSYLVAMLYCDLHAHHLHQLQSGLLDHFSTRGYSLLLHPCEGDDETVLQNLERKARYMNIDGFVLVPPLVQMPSLVSLLKKLDKPYIRIASKEEHDGSSEVLCNDEQAAYELTQHLIQKGHRHIGFVKGAAGCLAALRRYDGYLRALHVYNLPLNPSLVFEGDYDFSSGIAAGQHLLSLVQRPTAIFCSNDNMAAGVLNVAHAKGLSVPHQLALAGYDDSPLAQQVWPALTSVAQPGRKMAEVAANKLIDRIEKVEDAEYPQNIGCDIKYRASTQCEMSLSALAEPA